MKYLIGTILIAILSPAIAAETTNNDGTVFKTNEDTPAAQLCIAALESREALNKMARELKMSKKTLERVSCNEMSLVEFVKHHRDDMREWAIATVQ